MKVFRLYDTGKQSTGWMKVDAYTSGIINKIKDPSGLSSNIEVTSIPSPFARIDLVKSAFEYVTNYARENQNNSEGRTIFHKIVADSLDVAEMLFNYDTFKQDIKITPWEKNKQIKNLLGSWQESHKLLGKTLMTFWEQDKDAYNFNKTNKLYIIKYKNKIIGGTSPATLFFSQPDITSNIGIQIGNNKLFDNVYDPLYKRDPEFIKFLIIYFQNKQLQKDMDVLNKYINVNFKYLQEFNETLYNDLIKQIDTFNGVNASLDDDKTNFKAIDTGSTDDNIEILGLKYFAKKSEDLSKLSQFIIESGKYNGNELKRPMVLRKGFNKHLKYTDSTTWDPNFDVPEFDNNELNNRILPGVKIKYPYLTVGDFLEDNIIQLPYKIDSGSFFNGNLISDDQNTSYLLPIKKRFFDYFDSKFLISETDNEGNPIFEIKKLAGGNVRVFLRIPIVSGDFVEFQKQYSVTQINSKVASQVEAPVSIGIFPFAELVHTKEKDSNKYTVQLIDGNLEEATSYDLKVFNNEGEITTEKKTRTYKKDSKNAETTYYRVNSYISFIQLQLKTKHLSGVLIPLMAKKDPGHSTMTFAIDFGTTNTHIEYRKGEGEGEEKAFEINKSDLFYRSTLDMSNPPRELNTFSVYSRKELFPREIHSQGYTSFPVRTAINQNDHINFNKEEAKSFMEINPAFFYELETNHLQENISTNLKWSDYTKGETEHASPEKIRVQSYFESLLMLIRAKIILEDGDFDQVTLKWLYPTSMLPVRKEALANLWKKNVEKWISKQAADKIVAYSESIAPFYFFNKRKNVTSSGLPVASIDIGGGTTDIVIYENNSPKFTTSFRFAANSVFGDGYGGSASMNGFLLKYKKRFSNIFNAHKEELAFNFDKIYQEVEERTHSSSEAYSFLFNLKKQKKLDKIKHIIDFDEILSADDSFKIVFMLFYVSIIYHLAFLMKQSGEKNMPSFITFSGNGSKILTILNGKASSFKVLTELTEIIFNKIYQTEKGNKINIILPLNPKEVTCKGCVIDDDNSGSEETSTIPNYFLSNNQLINKNNSFTFKKIQQEIEEFKQNEIEEYKQFIKFFFELNKDINFHNRFGIPAEHLKDYEKILLSNAEILNYLGDGIEKKFKEIGKNVDQKVEETSFFYILHGMLFKLAKEISQFKD